MDMLLVTVAEHALLPVPGAQQEPADAYLRALRAAIAEAPGRGIRVAADAVVLETAAH